MSDALDGPAVGTERSRRPSTALHGQLKASGKDRGCPRRKDFSPQTTATSALTGVAGLPTGPANF